MGQVLKLVSLLVVWRIQEVTIIHHYVILNGRLNTASPGSPVMITVTGLALVVTVTYYATVGRLLELIFSQKVYSQKVVLPPFIKQSLSRMLRYIASYRERSARLNLKELELEDHTVLLVTLELQSSSSQRRRW